MYARGQIDHQLHPVLGLCQLLYCMTSYVAMLYNMLYHSYIATSGLIYNTQLM